LVSGSTKEKQEINNKEIKTNLSTHIISNINLQLRQRDNYQWKVVLRLITFRRKVGLMITLFLHGRALESPKYKAFSLLTIAKNRNTMVKT
jgi:hypothetical protein